MINDLTKNSKEDQGIVAKRYDMLVKQEDNFIIVVQQDDLVQILSVTVEPGTDMTKYINKYVKNNLALTAPEFKEDKMNFTIFPRFMLHYQDNEWLEL